MAPKAQLISLCLILFGCSHPSSWIVHSIAAGDQSFDVSRLRYLSSQAHPPLLFEMINFGQEIETYISLNRFHFTSGKSIKVSFTIDKEIFETMAPVYEGGMRIRLSHEITLQLIRALQEGKEIAILVDGFEELLKPAQFSSSFARFAKEGRHE